MPIRISAFGRVFAPSWPMTLVTVLLFALFISLGRWQWHRGEYKQALAAQFRNIPSAAPAATENPPNIDTLPRFSRVAFIGNAEPKHQFLLDNQIVDGKPGYEVLTPVRLNDGRRILVNRGWVPFTGYRDRLPDTAMSAGYWVLSGRVDELPEGGLASGRAPPDTSGVWPKVTAYPTHDELEAALGDRISRRIVLLDADVGGGYVREWSPPGLGPERHFSYAIQWWGFALVLLVLYFGLNFRKVS